MIVSVMPSPSATPTNPETMAAIIKMIIEKSLNWSINRISNDFFFFSFNWFKPYFSLLFATSSCDKPVSWFVSNSFSTSLISLLNQFFVSISSFPFFRFLICFEKHSIFSSYENISIFWFYFYVKILIFINFYLYIFVASISFLFGKIFLSVIDTFFTVLFFVEK